MISARIFKNKKNEVYGFELLGHAEYKDSGEDIICSAVSLLAINTVNAIEKFTEDDIQYEVNEEQGYILFSVTTEQITEQSAVLLKALQLGLNNIEQEYGKKYIHVKEV